MRIPRRLEPARIPVELDFRLTVLCRKSVYACFAAGSYFIIALSGGMNLNGGRFCQIKSPCGGIHVVTAKISQGTTSINPEVTPGNRGEEFVIRTHRSGSEPFVPEESVGKRTGFFGQACD